MNGNNNGNQRNTSYAFQLMCLGMAISLLYSAWDLYDDLYNEEEYGESFSAYNALYRMITYGGNGGWIGWLLDCICNRYLGNQDISGIICAFVLPMLDDQEMGDDLQDNLRALMQHRLDNQDSNVRNGVRLMANFYRALARSSNAEADRLESIRAIPIEEPIPSFNAGRAEPAQDTDSPIPDGIPVRNVDRMDRRNLLMIANDIPWLRATNISSEGVSQPNTNIEEEKKEEEEKEVLRLNMNPDIENGISLLRAPNISSEGVSQLNTTMETIEEEKKEEEERAEGVRKRVGKGKEAEGRGR